MAEVPNIEVNVPPPAEVAEAFVVWMGSRPCGEPLDERPWGDRFVVWLMVAFYAGWLAARAPRARE